MRNLLFIGALMLTTGCTSTWLETRAKDLAESKDAFEAAKPCCTSFAEMKFDELKVKGENKLVVGRENQAFIFDEGKSFFRAVKLPTLNYQYSINIETWNTDSLGFSSSLMSVHIFEPSLIFLDRDFNVVKKIAQPNMRYHTWMSTAGWETDISITGELSSAKYLVMYTNPSIVGTSNTATPGDLTVMAGSAFVSVPSDDYGIPTNYEGVINIEVDKI